MSDPIREALAAAKAHMQDLRDAWERGCISEHDGKGGMRSNRNVDVLAQLTAAIALLDKPHPDTERASGVALIAAERERQVSAEGWTPGHDAEHKNGEMALAAACYATPIPIKGKMLLPEERSVFGVMKWVDPWPWAREWDKRKKHDRERQLVIAGALIAAEIDRLRAIDQARGAA